MNPQAPSYAPMGVASSLASPADRLVARIIDGLVLLVPNILFFLGLFVVPLFLALASSEGNGASEGKILLWLFVAGLGYLLATALSCALTYWYDVKFEVKHGGQTLGKRWRKIRVVGLDGTELSTAQARKRWLASDAASTVSGIPFLGSLLGIYVLLDVLWLLWDKPYQQCLHDKYAKTIVVTAA